MFNFYNYCIIKLRLKTFECTREKNFNVWCILVGHKPKWKKYWKLWWKKTKCFEIWTKNLRTSSFLDLDFSYKYIVDFWNRFFVLYWEFKIFTLWIFFIIFLFLIEDKHPIILLPKNIHFPTWDKRTTLTFGTFKILL